MSSNSLVIFEKASISLKIFLQSLRFFEKPHITLKKPLKRYLKNQAILEKASISEKVLKNN
jgi:hypothetical protein